MVVKPSDAHDDYDNDRIGNDCRAATISQAVPRPRDTHELHVHVFNLVSESGLRIRSSFRKRRKKRNVITRRVNAGRFLNVTRVETSSPGKLAKRSEAEGRE